MQLPSKVGHVHVQTMNKPIQLLHCCICPKRPNFSDTSHLLTHVSSKGHLSHLHKLQVRSHQETAAAQQLSVYDRWSTEYNVAGLLSERMQQKEKKLAKRRADNEHRLVMISSPSPTKLDPKLLPNNLSPAQESHGYSSVDASIQNDFEHGSMYPHLGETGFTPGCLYTSVSVHDEHNNPVWIPENDDCYGTPTVSQQVTGRTTPEMARLKGTIWPGMDMFDSADQETQRKRNQRKDVSVLERMQTMSEMVEPTETVCSPHGTVKKRRHIDELEDDSPVEGESPPVRQSSKHKRRPLASISGNRTRITHRRPRKIKASFAVASTPTKERRTHRRQFNHTTKTCLSPKYNSIAETLYEPSASAHHKTHEFTIFEDTFPSQEVSSSTTDTVLSCFKDPIEVESVVLPPASWLQPMQQTSKTYDPFKEYRSLQVESAENSYAAAEKENVNPLAWQRLPKLSASNFDNTPYSHFTDFEDSLGALAEVYAFTKNPLLNSSPCKRPNYKTPIKKTRTELSYLDAKSQLYR